jgi:hypothetical protein
MIAQDILKESFVEITFEKETGIITAKWIGFLKLSDVQRGCDLLSKHIKNNKLKKHISDHTKLKVLSKEVQEYLTGQWFAEVEKLGLEKIAVHVSEDIFAQATVNNVNTKGSLGNLKIYTFNSLNQCNTWLAE